MSLRNEDRTDREVLLIIKDVAVGGEARTSDVCDYLRIPENNGKDRASVRQRLAWMKKYGWLDYNETDQSWSLTDVGKAVADGRLRASLEKTLSDLKPGERVLIMRGIVNGLFENGNAPVGTLVRREFLHHYSKRPIVRRKRTTTSR